MRNPSLPMLIWSSLRRSRSKASDPFEPLISQANAFLRPVANRVASIVPTAPFSKRTAASNASSTWRPGWNVAVRAATVSISPTRYRARSTTCVPRSPSAPEPARSFSKRHASSLVAPHSWR